MSDFLTDGADVTWVVGNYRGIPILIIQADGPHFAANAVSADYTNLRIRSAAMVGEGAVIHRLMVYDHPKDFLAPLLTSDMHEELADLGLQADEGVAWMLFVQFLIDGKQCSVVWVTKGKEDVEERRTQRQYPDEEVLPYWMKDLND